MSDTIQQAPTPQDVQLQITDLVMATQIIQLASQRGAIKAEEMETVGGVYNRFVTFLQASGALKPAEETATESTTAE